MSSVEVPYIRVTSSYKISQFSHPVCKPKVSADIAVPTLNVAEIVLGGAAALEVTSKVNATVEEEVCPNDEYLSKLKMKIR